MRDDDLAARLAAIKGDDPSPDFASSLREQLQAELSEESLGDGSITQLMIVDGQRARGEQPVTKRTWISGAVAAAAVLAVVGGLVIANNDDDETGVAATATEVAEVVEADPAQVIELLAAVYNADDIDAVMELFSDESVLTGHPFDPSREGLDEIRQIQIRDRATAATLDPWEILNLDVDGDTVTWDHVWTNDGGQDWCAEDHSATITNGKILIWEFAADPQPCASHSTVLLEYVAAYNGGDIERLMTLFSEETVITGHPFVPRSEGLLPIRGLQIRDMGDGASYVISNIDIAGFTVTWDHVWTDADGVDWCAEGHTATLSNSKILTWDFAPNPQLCAT